MSLKPGITVNKFYQLFNGIRTRATEGFRLLLLSFRSSNSTPPTIEAERMTHAGRYVFRFPRECHTSGATHLSETFGRRRIAGASKRLHSRVNIQRLFGSQRALNRSGLYGI